ncbi:hypothetical protein DSO57_1024839 [Entomophthora muscae]|nr:hypothetical protein DSO57_1024839 [Entomophthora muscae]
MPNRSKLTNREFNILESLFRQDSNPRLAIRRNLAKQLGMPQRTIQIWFQNRRAKAIRLNESSPPTRPSSPSLPTYLVQSHLPAPIISPTLRISEFWATTMSCIKYYRH